VQDLLEELEQNAIGYHLENIYVGSPACADDITFISSDKAVNSPPGTCGPY
jgi:hypothetical protein